MNKLLGVSLLPVLSGAAILMTSTAPAQSVSGAQLFTQRCAMCHKVAPGAPNSVGPNLAGITKRKSGMAAYNYSPALKKAAVVWNPANLDRYIAGPTKMVPGTKMFVGVADAAQRKAIVAYIATLK